MTDIPSASLTPIITALQADQANMATEIAALQALVGAAPPPPSNSGPITAPTGSIGPDTAGATWTWGSPVASEANQHQLLRNGAVSANGWVANTMQLDSKGVMWAHSNGGWFYWDGSLPQIGAGPV